MSGLVRDMLARKDLLPTCISAILTLQPVSRAEFRGEDSRLAHGNHDIVKVSDRRFAC